MGNEQSVQNEVSDYYFVVQNFSKEVEKGGKKIIEILKNKEGVVPELIKATKTLRENFSKNHTEYLKEFNSEKHGSKYWKSFAAVMNYQDVGIMLESIKLLMTLMKDPLEKEFDKTSLKEFENLKFASHLKEALFDIEDEDCHLVICEAILFFAQSPIILKSYKTLGYAGYLTSFLFNHPGLQLKGSHLAKYEKSNNALLLTIAKLMSEDDEKSIVKTDVTKNRGLTAFGPIYTNKPGCRGPVLNCLATMAIDKKIREDIDLGGGFENFMQDLNSDTEEDSLFHGGRFLLYMCENKSFFGKLRKNQTFDMIIACLKGLRFKPYARYMFQLVSARICISPSGYDHFKRRKCLDLVEDITKADIFDEKISDDYLFTFLDLLVLISKYILVPSSMQYVFQYFLASTASLIKYIFTKKPERVEKISQALTVIHNLSLNADAQEVMIRSKDYQILIDICHKFANMCYQDTKLAQLSQITSNIGNIVADVLDEKEKKLREKERHKREQELANCVLLSIKIFAILYSGPHAEAHLHSNDQITDFLLEMEKIEWNNEKKLKELREEIKRALLVNDNLEFQGELLKIFKFLYKGISETEQDAFKIYQCIQCLGILSKRYKYRDIIESQKIHRELMNRLYNRDESFIIREVARALFNLISSPNHLILWLKTDSDNPGFDGSLNHVILVNGKAKVDNKNRKPNEQISGFLYMRTSYDDGLYAPKEINLKKYTISVWFFYPKLPPKEQALLDKFKGEYCFHTLLQDMTGIGGLIVIDPNYEFLGMFDSKSGEYLTMIDFTKIEINPETWHHLVVTVDEYESKGVLSKTKCQLITTYLDNDKISEVKGNALITVKYFGNSKGGSEPFGYFGDLRIYDYPFREEEITAVRIDFDDLEKIPATLQQSIACPKIVQKLKNNIPDMQIQLCKLVQALCVYKRSRVDFVQSGILKALVPLLSSQNPDLFLAANHTLMYLK